MRFRFVPVVVGLSERGTDGPGSFILRFPVARESDMTRFAVFLGSRGAIFRYEGDQGRRMLE